MYIILLIILSGAAIFMDIDHKTLKQLILETREELLLEKDPTGVGPAAVKSGEGAPPEGWQPAPVSQEMLDDLRAQKAAAMQTQMEVLHREWKDGFYALNILRYATKNRKFPEGNELPAHAGVLWAQWQDIGSSLGFKVPDPVRMYTKRAGVPDWKQIMCEKYAEVVNQVGCASTFNGYFESLKSHDPDKFNPTWQLYDVWITRLYDFAQTAEASLPAGFLDCVTQRLAGTQLELVKYCKEPPTGD